MTHRPPPGVRLRGIAKSFGHVAVLHGIDLTLPAAAATGLLGVNGAGKTTLVRILAGLARPSAGVIELAYPGVSRDGADAIPEQRRPLDAARDVALVPQTRPLYGQLSAEEMLQLAAGMNRDTWDGVPARDWLDRFDVPTRRPCGQLSGGERSHISIAMALGRRTPVLLMDEPFAELDPLAREDAAEALGDHVRTTGRTLVISSHVLADIEKLCSHVVVIARGRTVLSGDTATLRRRDGVATTLSEVVLPAMRGRRGAP